MLPRSLCLLPLGHRETSRGLCRDWCKGDIWTIPNALSFTRLSVTPYIGYLILHDQYDWALGISVTCGLTDLVDGWLARRFKMGSFVGSLLDPLADKALITTLTLCLSYQHLIPLPLATLIIGRDVGLVLATVIYRYRMLPSPITLKRFFDVSYMPAEVRPTTISKVNTALQLLLVASTLVDPVFPSVFLAYPQILQGLQYTVGATTVLSAASYLVTKDVVRRITSKSP
ncbi:MAG: hypothetical protein DHS80DRAFT_26973 [Piptocephalis tieghemiana]|nr:MAG: hypothetical protein DHS80DRAFT_26973 [Piptocephalis tieghemiana]